MEDSNARIKEHFQEYDKLRRGTISQTKFQIACTSAKFVLNGAEYDALFELFAVQGAANSDMVNYKDFTEFLDGDRNAQVILHPSPVELTHALQVDTAGRHGALTERRSELTQQVTRLQHHTLA